MNCAVISCFHNSERRLPAYFAALRRLDVTGLTTEFIFVDNASTDRTFELIVAELESLPAPGRLISEDSQGLMYARCAGVAAASSEWVLFLDDDNEPCEDYLQQLSRLVERFPRAAFFSGNSVTPPEYAPDRDVLLAADLIALRHRTAEVEFELRTASHALGPWGAGLCGRRTDVRSACVEWQQCGSRVVGRSGLNLSGGEDHWIIHHVCRTNPRVVFSDKLTLIHRVDRSRLQPEHIAKVSFQLGADWPNHLDEFKRLRPELPDVYPIGWRVWWFALWRVPRSILVHVIRRRYVSLASVAWHFGLLQELLLRDWRQRARNATPIRDE